MPFAFINRRATGFAPAHKPSIYRAWRPTLLTNPVFIPLGACPRTQVLSRLAAAHEPRFYPAWRLPTNPVFIPLRHESSKKNDGERLDTVNHEGERLYRYRIRRNAA